MSKLKRSVFSVSIMGQKHTTFSWVSWFSRFLNSRRLSIKSFAGLMQFCAKYILSILLPISEILLLLRRKKSVLLCTSERRNILNQIFAQPMSMYTVQNISNTGTKCPWTYDAHSNPGSNWVKGKIWLYSNVDKHEFAQNYVTCDKNKLYQQHRYTMNKLAIDVV